MSSDDTHADGAAAASGLSRGFASGRPALVVYLMAGYPDRERSLEALRAATAAGADVIELGVPYGDPLADGPVIVNAADVAREASASDGFGLAETVDLAAEFLAEKPAAHGRSLPPVALMTYLNPMLRFGLPALAASAAAAGVSGVIIPDMPPDSPFAGSWLAAAAAEGLDTVFLVAPTSTDDRIRLAVGASSGFVYCVSTTGVTGERAKVPEGLAELVERVRAVCAEENRALPVAVGFGIGSADAAACVSRVADGVIVGSAAVRRQDDAVRLASFVRALADAVCSGCEHG